MVTRYCVERFGMLLLYPIVFLSFVVFFVSPQLRSIITRELFALFATLLQCVHCAIVGHIRDDHSHTLSDNKAKYVI